MKKLSVIILLLFVYTGSKAQENKTVYFANENVAIQERNDSIFFYTSQGKLEKLLV